MTVGCRPGPAGRITSVASDTPTPAGTEMSVSTVNTLTKTEHMSHKITVTMDLIYSGHEKHPSISPPDSGRGLVSGWKEQP